MVRKGIEWEAKTAAQQTCGMKALKWDSKLGGVVACFVGKLLFKEASLTEKKQTYTGKHALSDLQKGICKFLLVLAS